MKLLTSLNIFLNKKYKIKLILQNLNKGLSCRLTNAEAIEFRNIVMQLRVYHNASFFKEIINIFIVLLKNDLQVKILTEFIEVYTILVTCFITIFRALYFHSRIIHNWEGLLFPGSDGIFLVHLHN
jgi:hypothetical protein